MTIYFFVKNVVIFVWRLHQIWRSCRPSIIFTIDSRSSSLSNWWENCMTLSITCKSSKMDWILSGSLISSSISSLLDASITSSAGFSYFSMICFQISCRQEKLLASTAGIEEELSLSKFTKSSGSTSPASSFTKLANSSSSSWSSVCTTPSWALLRKPHLGNQVLTVWSETSCHTALIQEIAFNTSTSWKISEAFLLSSIREIKNSESLFRYLTWKFLIIPASRGCSLDVVFLCKKLPWYLGMKQQHF